MPPTPFRRLLEHRARYPAGRGSGTQGPARLATPDSPELLRALMNRWDYSLADVATVAGTHRSAIDHLLHGRSHGLREDRAVRVAAALRVDLETLFVDPTVSVPSSVTWGRGRPRPPEVRRVLDEQAAQPPGGEPAEAV